MRRPEDPARDRDAHDLPVLRRRLLDDRLHGSATTRSTSSRCWSTSRATPTARSTAARCAPRARRRCSWPSTRTGRSTRCTASRAAPSGQRISWDDALDRLARYMKDSRDNNFVETDDDGLEVNRNDGLRLRRRGDHHLRGGVPHRQVHPGLGVCLPRTTGSRLTRSHGGQFGRLLRSWGDDQPLARLQEQRRASWSSGPTRPRTTPAGGSGPTSAVTSGARRSSTSTPASPGRRPSPTCTSRSGPAPTSPSSAG